MRRINLLRNVIVSAAMFVSHFMSGAESADSLLVMFWNVENFFDYKDGGAGESDKDFSSFGSHHWTKRRFQAKCDGIAKSVLWLSDKYGRLPDVIGLAEVENRNVLYRLLNRSALKKTDYRIIHSDSRDRRGIDVALLYRESVLSPASITFRTPVHEGDTLHHTHPSAFRCLFPSEFRGMMVYDEVHIFYIILHIHPDVKDIPCIQCIPFMDRGPEGY